MSNTTYVALHRIQRRGRVWEEGDEVPEAHHMPIWRKSQMEAGNLKMQGADPGDPADMTINDLTEHVATLDNVDVLLGMLDTERNGRGRAGAIAAIEARLDELTEGEEEA